LVGCLPVTNFVLASRVSEPGVTAQHDRNDNLYALPCPSYDISSSSNLVEGEGNKNQFAVFYFFIYLFIFLFGKVISKNSTYHLSSMLLGLSWPACFCRTFAKPCPVVSFPPPAARLGVSEKDNEEKHNIKRIKRDALMTKLK